MVSQTHSIDDLITQARTDPDRLGELLERYRPYLNLVSGQRIDPRIVGRVCAGDLVQDTLTESATRFNSFRGHTEAEFSTWIQTILNHILEDAVRVHVIAEKRSVVRERPLYALSRSASFYWFDFAASDPTPSKHLVRGEKALRLAELINSLPGKQGVAIRLRYFDGKKVRQIAEEMGLTHSAVAGLLKRGIRILRSSMNEASWFSDSRATQQ